MGGEQDLTEYRGQVVMLINVASNYLIGGMAPARYGNGHPNIVPYRDFTCRDGEIALCDFLHAFRQALERASDPYRKGIAQHGPEDHHQQAGKDREPPVCCDLDLQFVQQESD